MSSASEALAAAVAHHRAGRFAEAERLYRQILRDNPRHADALHLLGLIAHEAGRNDLAADYIGHALGLRPDAPSYYLSLGLVQQSAGRPAEAVRSFRHALALRPDYAEAHNNLGAVLRAQGRLEGADIELRRALDLRPDFAEAHSNLGQVLEQQGRFDEALASYGRALQLEPNLAEAHFNRGHALGSLGRTDEALASLQRALELRPEYADAHRALGILLTEQDRPGEALPHLRAWLRLQPQNAEARDRLGEVLRLLGKAEEAAALAGPPVSPAEAIGCKQRGDVLLRRGQVSEAAAAYRQAVALWPGYADAHNDLGNALQQLGDVEAAAASYQRALQIEPAHAPAHSNLGVLFKDQGRLDQAAQHLQAALAVKPTGLLRVLLATLLPPVYRSLDDVAAWRARLQANLSGLRPEEVALNPAREIVPNLFYLAYQGGNDREIQRTLAGLYQAGLTTGDLPAPRPGPPGSRIRVGFISKYFKDHTIGTLMRGLVPRISRQSFTVTVLTFPHRRDPVTDFFQKHADRTVMLPEDVPAARRIITDLKLDVLFYADVGMDPLTYTLAFSRLAPVQCVTWGHPLTTGIPAMDYFVSSDLVEPPDADEHYTESLVRLPTLPFYYYRPPMPAERKGRVSSGLPAEAHLYACLQTLFKFHPAFDEVLAGVLRRDPRGILVLVRGKYRPWEEALLARWSTTMPDVLERIHWLPPQPRTDFHRLMAESDVLLDTFPFSGGNTSYEGLALGVPIVTLAAPYLRGRLTLGMYRKMGMMDCVARSPEEYINQAIHLGTDANWRQEIRTRIQASCGVLFEDEAAVQQLEEFFRRAVEAARNH